MDDTSPAHNPTTPATAQYTHIGGGCPKMETASIPTRPVFFNRAPNFKLDGWKTGPPPQAHHGTMMHQHNPSPRHNNPDPSQQPPQHSTTPQPRQPRQTGTNPNSSPHPKKEKKPP